MDNKVELWSRIEELGQTTIEAIEHAVLLTENEEAEVLTTLPLMTEVMEAYTAIGEALPLTADQREKDGTEAVSVDQAFASLVKAYEAQDIHRVRSAIKDEILPLYKFWFDAIQESLPYPEQ